MSNDAGICAATCRLWYGLSLLSGTYLSDWRRRGKDFSTDIVFDGIKSACTGCPTVIIVINGIIPVVVVAGLVVDEVLVVVVVVIAAVLSESSSSSSKSGTRWSSSRWSSSTSSSSLQRINSLYQL